MNSLAIGIVHPAFEQLKRLGRFLHLVAGLLIMIHAFNQLKQPSVNYLYFWCLLIVSFRYYYSRIGKPEPDHGNAAR
jgi:hypothetical protein